MTEETGPWIQILFNFPLQYFATLPDNLISYI